MERSVLLNIILSLILVFPTVLCELNVALNYDNDLKASFGKKYDIRGSITLLCTVTATEGEKFSVKWEKDGKLVQSLPTSKDRYIDKTDGKIYGFRLTHATEDDAGTYYCVISEGTDEVHRSNITLFSKYRVKTADNLNFVEGEMIRIPCIVHGKPTPIITWKVGNETYDESTDRIVLERDNERDVDNAIFIIKEAAMSDRGVYTCIGKPEIGNEVMDETMIRIKDKYAALWPFLGICAEVFVLCAIILIYEKKRNKTELEESDTDQSPDQKNTPDDGKDSNLRHRQ